MKIALLLFGAFISSFLNVGIEERFLLKRWIFGGRSRCDSCHQTLRWWELVPVLSWLALGGRCARCGRRISVMHPLSELSLGIAFMVGGVYFGSDPALLVEYLVVAIVLYIFAMYDLMHRIVPTRLVVLGLVLFPLKLLLFPHVPALSSAEEITLTSRILGLVTLSGVFALVNALTYFGLFPGVAKGKQGFGWGDVKLSLFLGLLIGWPLVNVAFWVAVFSGAIVGIIIYINVRKRYVKLPFVPFLVAGAWVAMLWGRVMMKWFMRVLFNI